MADKMRLIDANRIVEVAERAYNVWNLANATADSKREINRVYKMMELCKAVRAVAMDCPTVDAVEVVRCAQCIYRVCDEDSQKIGCGIHDLTLMEITDQSFCSAGMTEAQWLARYGDELEDGDPLKPTKEQPMHRILDLGDRQESGLLEED